MKTIGWSADCRRHKKPGAWPGFIPTLAVGGSWLVGLVSGCGIHYQYPRGGWHGVANADTLCRAPGWLGK